MMRIYVPQTELEILRSQNEAMRFALNFIADWNSNLVDKDGRLYNTYIADVARYYAGSVMPDKCL